MVQGMVTVMSVQSARVLECLAARRVLLTDCTTRLFMNRLARGVVVVELLSRPIPSQRCLISYRSKV